MTLVLRPCYSNCDSNCPCERKKRVQRAMQEIEALDDLAEERAFDALGIQPMGDVEIPQDRYVPITNLLNDR